MYVPNPVNFTYVLLSRALEGKQLAAAKDAAAQAVRALQLGATSFVAVAAFPGRTANAVVVKTALTSAAGRDTILAEIEAITSDASISDFNAALSAVLDQVRAARTASDLTSGDIVNVATLVNSSDDNSITKATLERVRAERVSVRAVATTFAATDNNASSSRSMGKAERFGCKHVDARRACDVTQRQQTIGALATTTGTARARSNCTVDLCA